jgi:hypothetical protein
MLRIQLTPENKKAGYFVPGFFFVDKRFEISNLELIKDMHSIIKLCEVPSISLKDEGSGFVT